MSAPQLSPPSTPATVARDVAAFARTLVTAVRTQQMYSARHPAAQTAVERCRSTLSALAGYDDFVLGVTPDTLLVNGEPLPSDVRLREACGLLNDHDIVRLRVVAEPRAEEFLGFLHLLLTDADTIRERGGPASVWEASNHHWLRIDQLDYASLLVGAVAGSVTTSNRPAEDGLPKSRVARRDDIWRSIVRAMADGRTAIDAGAERRLMEIAHSPDAIAALAAEAADSQTVEGAARSAAQAAAVLTTYQRLTTFVELQTPSDVEAVVNNIATAAGKADPTLFMRVVSEAAESGVGLDVIKAVGARFTDEEASRLLGAAFAAEGKASTRMAAALNTLVPDEDRRGRVLRLARGRGIGSSSPAAGDLSAAWTALERLLTGPADSDYVSRLYGESLAYAEARSNRLRLDAPQKLDQWVRSIAPESVRALSTTLLLDLFGLEHGPGIVDETARDLAALAEDLLLASDASDAARVVEALCTAAESGDDDNRRNAAAAAIAGLRRSAALGEAASIVGELDEREFEAFGRICRTLGPETCAVLVSAMDAAASDLARTRLRALIIAFGDAAIESVAGALDAANEEQARDYIRLIGQLGGLRAVAALQTLARSSRPDLTRGAVHELISSEDPASARALAALLKNGTPDARVEAIDLVAGSHHPKAGRLLCNALDDADALGDDWAPCQRILAALRLGGGAEAVPSLVRVMRLTSWRAWRRASRLKQAAVSVLADMGTREAREALEDATATGDVLLRHHARAALRAGG